MGKEEQETPSFSFYISFSKDSCTGLKILQCGTPVGGGLKNQQHISWLHMLITIQFNPHNGFALPLVHGRS